MYRNIILPLHIVQLAIVTWLRICDFYAGVRVKPLVPLKSLQHNKRNVHRVIGHVVKASYKMMPRHNMVLLEHIHLNSCFSTI